MADPFWNSDRVALRQIMQEGCDYCAAAVAQAVLDFHRVTSDQDDLLERIGSPRRLDVSKKEHIQMFEAVVNEEVAGGIPRGAYKLYVSTSRDEARRLLVGSILRGSPTAGLILAGTHWVTVRGVRAESNLFANPDAHFMGFITHNPEPPYCRVRSSMPPGRESSIVVEPAFTPWNEWEKMHESVRLEDHGLRWVGLGSPDPVVGLRFKLREQPRPDHRAKRLTDAGVLTALKQGIEWYRLGQTEMFGELSEGEFGSPKLVQGLAGYRSYFLVPVSRGDKILGAFRLDASTGVFLGAQVLSGSIQDYLPDPRSLGERPPDEYSVDPRLYWGPNLVSASPYFPLFKVKIHGGPEVYKSMSGEEWETLPLAL